jgi:REase_AHJR-like
MHDLTTTAEFEALDAVKQQYVRKGYRFIVEPDRADIPKFLEGISPDALAISNGDKVIFEVKSSRQSAEKSRQVAFLAREVPKHSGWRFELVLAGSEGEMTDKQSEPTLSTIDQEISRSQGLLQAGDPKLALITGWALLEAVSRRLVLNADDTHPRRYKPSSVVEALVSQGMISDADGEKLSSLAKTRNRLVHGFVQVQLASEDVTFLLDKLKTLFGQIDEKS